ncbi:MAG: NADH-quinone oxidoreductase subunit M [Deltaproteobacteria bacterium]
MILVWLIAVPIVAGVVSAGVARWDVRWSRWVALLALLLELIALVVLWIEYGAAGRFSGADPWLIDLRVAWIPQLGISFHLAMDGLSLLMVALTLFLGLASVICSWTEIQERVGLFHFNLMAVLTGIIGVFLAFDLFLFYFFWEVMLVPMFLLVAIWGHENRRYAAIKFFLFTQAGGLAMLAAIVALYFIHGSVTGTYTFDYFDLLKTPMSAHTALLVMLGFFLAFAVKLPAVPFHTWLPDAHTEAPTAGSVILAGLLLKTGGYGLIRFMYPVFPEAAQIFAPVAMTMAVVGILYGAVLAFSQSDLKRLVAYTSISHLGFVLLGVFSGNLLALQGAVVQMIAHGISTGSLFILVGMVQERIHTREMSSMGGFWTGVPRLSGVSLVFALASLGLPGLGNFVGEFLVLLGTYQTNPWMAAVAVIGLVLATIYSVWMMAKVFFGPVTTDWKIADLNVRESALMAVMIGIIVWLGIYPQQVLNSAESALQALRRPAHAKQTWLLGKRPTDRPRFVSSGAAAGLALTFLSALLVTGAAPEQVTSLVIVDRYSLFFIELLSLASLAVIGLSYRYLERRRDNKEEYYVLLLLATLGSAVLVSSTHFASFFIGLEILSVALYALVAYQRAMPIGAEAGIKYLILAAISSAFLLFGMAVIYSQSGTLEFARIVSLKSDTNMALWLLGTAMLVTGLGFKLALVPFHMWAPDVYQGAPAPITAFLATVSKGAVFPLMLRYFVQVDIHHYYSLVLAFSVIAVVSMVVGNLLALLQSNVKRILAYSSIAHLGYLMVAFLASGKLAVAAVSFYLVAYVVTSLGAFGVITVISGADRDADLMEDYRGLSKRHRWLAAGFTAMLLSLAGIPLTAGFVGKFYLVAAGIGSSLWFLVATLIITSVIGLYYYLRIIVAMYSAPIEDVQRPADSASISLADGLTLGCLAVLLIWFGVYPSPLIRVIQSTLTLVR